jgi:hypothetical protein
MALHFWFVHSGYYSDQISKYLKLINTLFEILLFLHT